MNNDSITEEHFTYYPYEVLEKHRESLSRLYTFLKRYVRKTIALSSSSNYGMGLFSEDGILLDLYAKDKLFLEFLAEDGIHAGSDWVNIGYNAVEKGLREQISLSSVGSENEFGILQNYAIYFAPISMLSPYEPYEQMEKCGLAIIAPLETAWSEFLTMVRGTAHDMMITLQFNNIATMYYERSGKGILSIDNMMSPDGTYLATYYNDELYRVLETDPVEMYYKPVKALLDPLPANEELWDIVVHHRTLCNHPMTVTCHGKSVDVIATTDAYNQPTINAHGVTFYFTTQQKMTARVSEKMANGAIKTFDGIIGNSSEFQKDKFLAGRMAETDSNIMILGESGTGKDIFAQAIHNASSRREKPFIALNCGALPRDLIESELFGYDAGAFSGARKNGNIGKFELANGGTIFLDEIGEMPLDLQVKLLRVVEQKSFMRLGGNRLINVDVRIIAATNANIEEMIETKQFRSDLFYRLSTMKLYLPPLRERRDDIPVLADYFIRNISARINKTNIMHFSDKAKDLLVQLPWPGNVRELQNCIECIVQLYPGDIILPEYILDNIPKVQKEEYLLREKAASEEPISSVSDEHPVRNTSKNDVVQAASFSSEKDPASPRGRRLQHKEITPELLTEALDQCYGNRSEAAKYLGISRRTFYRKLEEFGIS